MKRKSKKEELSSPRLNDLKKDFERIEKAEEYLEIETEKLKKEEEKVRKKIEKEKEKEILGLRKRINFLQGRKKK
jgi:hypothetical protein